MGTGIHPTNDYAFKFVFGTEERTDVLALLINAVITDSGGVPMLSVQLLNPFSVKETIDDRVGILDIRARDNWDRENLVEMQMASHAGFAERVVWYTAKHYDQQLEEGERFSALRPVTMICFVNDVLFDDHSGQYHWCFKLTDKDSGRELTDQFVIHIVELPKFNKTSDELVSELDRWIYFLKHGSTLDLDNLPPPLQSDGFTKAVKGLVMLSLDEQKRDDYTRRRMWEMDQLAFREDALKRELDGELRGELRGELKGRSEGLAEGALTMLVRSGTRTLGAPPPEVLARLKAIQRVSEFEALMDQLPDISSWDELLSHRP